MKISKQKCSNVTYRPVSEIGVCVLKGLQPLQINLFLVWEEYEIKAMMETILDNLFAFSVLPCNFGQFWCSLRAPSSSNQPLLVHGDAIMVTSTVETILESLFAFSVLPCNFGKFWCSLSFGSFIFDHHHINFLDDLRIDEGQRKVLKMDQNLEMG